MPLITLSTVLAGAVTQVMVPFINKVVSPTGEDLGVALRDRIKRVLHSAEEMTVQTGIEPHQVALKMLRPIVEGASLEDDETLATKWAALLANAATTPGDTLVEPSFADVLRQLTPLQAQILDELYKQVNGDHLQNEGWGRQTLEDRQVRQVLGVEFALFGRCMDNLIRLRLLSKNVPAGSYSVFSSRSYITLEPTFFGYAFVTACKPPVKQLPYVF